MKVSNINRTKEVSEKTVSNYISVPQFGSSYFEDSRLVELLKMGPQREVFFDYQFSTTMKIDILAATDSHKKQ